MVVFWKEDSGRQLRLSHFKTKEQMRPDLHHPPRFTFFDGLDPPDTSSAPPGPPGPPDSPGLPLELRPLLQLLVGKKEQELKMYHASDHDHDLNHQSLNRNQFQ